MYIHIPIAITAALRQRGINVLTSQEDETATQDDESLLERATSLGRVLFSQDQDFLQIAASWRGTGRSFVGLFFSAQKGVSLGSLTKDLELLLTYCEPDELKDRVVYLSLR